ncbi:protein impact-b [Plakobranchus ocellatus]|uniref:Protein impact-b n=1 Tax=Plakobranchus ocellatus TaxID=259542 RepID=A0AAV4BUV0_9GAST|nr:protein impact-b [Plakobranchus ocellatus]
MYGPVFGFFTSMVAYLLSVQVPLATVAESRRDTQHQLSDGLPAPRPGLHASVFTRRVLRWHEDYCGKSRLCRESTLLHTPECYRCAPCRCDIHCQAFGDCCPDVALTELSTNLFSRSERLFQASVTCESSEIQLFLPMTSSSEPPNSPSQPSQTLDPSYEQQPVLANSAANNRGTYIRNRGGLDRDSTIPKFYMISRCPNTFTRDSSECQNGGVMSPVSPAGYNGRGISQSDPPAVYRNIHCARCHGVYDTVPWNIRVICTRMKNLPSFSTPRNLTLTLALDPDCAVIFTPPPAPNHRSRLCYIQPDMISSCNVTGAWRKRDSFLERACLSYLTPKTVGGKLYQNVFCFLCNHDDQDGSTQFTLTACQHSPNLAISSGLEGAVNLPLSLTLANFDITRELTQAVLFEGPTDRKCQDSELYDSKKVRRKARLRESKR